MELNDVLLEQFYESMDLKEMFKGMPHVLKNNEGHIISQMSASSLEEVEEKMIKMDERTLFSLKIEGQWSSLFEHYLIHLWESFKREEKDQGNLDQKEILKKDLDGLLKGRSFHTDQDMKNFFSKALVPLTFSFPCEEISLYHLEHGEDLKEIVTLNVSNLEQEKDKKEEILPLDGKSIESISCLSEYPYIISDTSEISDFEIPKKWKNYGSFPLYSGDEIVGVMSLKNSLHPDFSLADFEMIEVVCQSLGNILEQGIIQHELEESTKDNKFLGNYISKFLLSEIEEEGGQDRFKAMKKEVVSLFADIRSFTSISEKLDPKVLINLLNIYFEEVTSVIEEHYGTVDKLVGDMIMVKWNIPHDVPDARVHAVKAAVAMQKKMITKVVPHWKEAGVPMVGIGIGVECGSAYVGNVGSSSFINYTAFGESVEVAAQLEALARPGQVLITDQYFKKVQGKVPKPYKQFRNVSLKGRGDNNLVQVIKTLDYPDYTQKK